MMLTKEKITDILSEKSEYLAEVYGVKKIGLFGSYANGTYTEASDIDIIVEFETPLGFKFMEFADYLEELLGKPVDVLTVGGLQGIRIPHIVQSTGKVSSMSNRVDKDFLYDIQVRTKRIPLKPVCFLSVKVLCTFQA